VNLLYVAGRFPKTSESFVFNEVRAQLDAGHRVRVASLRPREVDTAPDGLPADAVIEVPRLPFARPFVPSRAEVAVPEERWTRKAYATIAARWIAAALEDFRPDVIHAHFANLPTLVAGHLSVLLDVPHTFMPHATDYRQKMSDDLLRRRIRFADGTFVISEAARQEIAARARLSPAETDGLRVIRAAVQPLDVAAAAPRLDDGVVRVISVARHVPMKGIDLALRAFAKLAQIHPSARYDLVGDGPETRRLRALVAALGIRGAVTFHGRLPNDAAQRLLARSDIAVLPCRRESSGAEDGLPVFLMEAGGHGVPVVTTAISGIPELVEHDRGGLIVPQDDVDALADALSRLMRSAALRARMGACLRARVQDEFDRARQVDRQHRHWSQLTGDAPADGDRRGPRQPLSVVIVGRDEADVIARCVHHARWADEVLVAVDSRTTDDTAQQARAAGARTCEVEWRGFSATKNDAAKLARHDWILSLDADEAVSDRLRQGIEAVLGDSPDPRDGYALERRSDFLGALLPNDTRASTRRASVRLFHRAHCAWDESTDVHEQATVQGRTHQLPGILVQWRDFTIDELLRRFNRYATLESEQLARQGRRVRPIEVVLRPVARFGWHYVARGEFRLGARGLLHSALKATAEYMRCAKLWELQHQNDAARDGFDRAVKQH